MSNRTMFDGVTMNDVPATGAQMIAYDVNGEFAFMGQTLTAIQRRWADASLVPVDVLANMPDRARVLDVETGDADPQQGRLWIALFNQTNPDFRHGARPVIYCQASSVEAVREGTGEFVLGRDYYLWVAQWGNTPYEGEGIVAWQRQNVDNKYDVSTVWSDAWMPR
jgi:hypothetical protein